MNIRDETIYIEPTTKEKIEWAQKRITKLKGDLFFFENLLIELKNKNTQQLKLEIKFK